MLKQLTAAGGVVHHNNGSSSEPEVLLIFRRGVWDLPKGKLEAGESIAECAMREVAEEVGISMLPAIAAEITQTYHEYEQKGQKYGKTTHWFAMHLTDPVNVTFQPQTEEGIKQVRWYPLGEAKKQVGYDNLTDVLDSFDAWYNGRE